VKPKLLSGEEREEEEEEEEEMSVRCPTLFCTPAVPYYRSCFKEFRPPVFYEIEA
jgi:hypothetical protein